MNDERAAIRFHYDFVCPWAYLASLEVDRLERAGTMAFDWRPILLGGVFRAIGNADQPTLQLSPPRQRYAALDLERWATRLGVALRWPESHPRRTVLALRAALASGDVRTASRALFAAYWRDGRDLEDRAVVAEALEAAGLDGRGAVERAESRRDELFDRTKEAVDAGVFGVPSFVVDGPKGRSLFWGVDRLDEVRRAIRPRKTVAFYFDYSSPYAYLGATQIRRIAGQHGARLELRPVLLGALFRTIGTPDVPLFAMPVPKQRYQGEELSRFAERHGVSFRFSSRFPVRTVDALRLTMIAPEERRADLVDALFRATWVEDRDVASRAELRAILSSIGLDAELAERIDDPSVKEALRSANDSAIARGVFGVPTFEVDGEMYWGQDRLDWVERALATNET